MFRPAASVINNNRPHYLKLLMLQNAFPVCNVITVLNVHDIIPLKYVSLNLALFLNVYSKVIVLLPIFISLLHSFIYFILKSLNYTSDLEEYQGQGRLYMHALRQNNVCFWYLRPWSYLLFIDSFSKLIVLTSTNLQEDQL